MGNNVRHGPHSPFLIIQHGTWQDTRKNKENNGNKVGSSLEIQRKYDLSHFLPFGGLIIMEHGTPLQKFRYPQGKSFGKTTVVERIKPYNICSYNIEDNTPSLILHAHT